MATTKWDFIQFLVTGMYASVDARLTAHEAALTQATAQILEAINMAAAEQANRILARLDEMQRNHQETKNDLAGVLSIVTTSRATVDQLRAEVAALREQLAAAGQVNGETATLLTTIESRVSALTDDSRAIADVVGEDTLNPGGTTPTP